MTASVVPPRPTRTAELSGFGSLVRSEWTKFRTVRGWLISLFVATALCSAFTFVVANGNHEGSCTVNGVCTAGHPFVPTGPNGLAVADSYEFVDQRFTGDCTLTARVTSLTGLIWSGPASVAPSLAHTRPGLAAWAKAGVLITPSTTQGSPYVAVMATGSRGTRFQYDYTHDQPGKQRAVSATSPQWLRLTRTGDTITGYESTNSTKWIRIGSAHLPGLPAAVSIGLFVTSPVSFRTSASGTPTEATAVFDQITVNSRPAIDAWQGRSIGTSPHDYYPTLGAGDYHGSGSTFVLSGSGDIAPAVNPMAGGDTASGSLWFGLIVALLVLIVVATMFITVEYRRGLIRTTFTVTPQRSSVLAAKAAVIGVAAFVVGAIAAAVGIPVGSHVLTAGGNYVFPSTTITKFQIIVGSGAFLALTAVAVLAVGTVLRAGASAITIGVALFVLPYLVSTYSSGGVETWLFRLTPAAAFSILGVIPRSALVDAPYTMSNGYYPLAPWAGLLVLCAYTGIALAIATFGLRRRDA